MAAWILTGLSLYAWVWIIGDFHALRHRPVRISERTLHLRLGLRWTASIPLASILAVRAPTDNEKPGGKEHLQALLIGAPNRRLELSEPVTAIGLYGFTRRVTTIDLQIDDLVAPRRHERPESAVGRKRRVT